jgi:hypothetical protein
MRKICAKKLITSQIGRYRDAVVSAAVSLADHANVDHTPTYGTAAVAYDAVLRGVVAAHGYGICAPCGRALLSLFISRISAISCKDRSFLDSRAMNFDAQYHHLEFGAHALGEFEIGVRVVGVGSSHFH